MIVSHPIQSLVVFLQMESRKTNVPRAIPVLRRASPVPPTSETARIIANVKKNREKYCIDRSLTALCDQDKAASILERGESAPIVSDLFSEDKTGTCLALVFINLKLDCQLVRKVWEMVSEINTATAVELRPRYTVELDQTKLNELMKGPTRETIMVSGLTAHDVMKAIAVCVGIHRLTESKSVDNDEVRKIHK